MSTGISDETWRALDSTAARLTPGTRRRVGVVVVVTALLALGLQAMVSAGEFAPQLYATHWTITARIPEVDRVDMDVTIRNDAWSDEVITRIDAGLPDVEASMHAGRPVIPARGSRTMTVSFFVNRCSSASGSDFLVEPRLTLRRFWGETHTRLYLNTVSDGARTLPHPYVDGLVALACQ